MATARKRQGPEKGFYKTAENGERFKCEKLPRKLEVKIDKTKFYPIEVSMGQVALFLDSRIINIQRTNICMLSVC